MRAARALDLFSQVAELARLGVPISKLYQAIDAALHELMGRKLLTILRLADERLYRMYTSDLSSYPVGGSKSIRNDGWLQSMLADGVPVISPDPKTVQQRFVDHEAIIVLGCGSVMNLPITCPFGTLGSLNLLHEAGWFAPEHILLARPFATLLAVAWLGEELSDHGSWPPWSGEIATPTAL